MNKGSAQLLSIISDGLFHSGEELAQQLNVSRAAIWKIIKQLELLGISIEAVRGKGYRLLKPIELLSKERILEQFDINKHKAKLDILFSTDSTNNYLLQQLTDYSIHGHVVLAEYQSNGKGRRGNKWVSPFANGLYVSIGWQFDLFSESMGLLSLYIAVSVVNTLKELNINNVALKWPNDILVNNKKIGGILLDMRGEINGPATVIIGIGVNYDIDKEESNYINQEITDINKESSGSVSRNEFVSLLLKNTFILLEKVKNEDTLGLLDLWRGYDCFKGKKARLQFQNKQLDGVVEGVDDQGSLLMNIDGNVHRYTSGELSLRLVS